MEMPLLSHSLVETASQNGSQKEESPLTQAQIQAFQEAFSMFDKVESQTVSFVFDLHFLGRWWDYRCGRASENPPRVRHHSRRE